MNKHECNTEEEFQTFVDTLVAEKKWAIDVRQDDGTGTYTVYWTEHKSYTSRDGTSYPDEIWTTIDGTMMCVQDMEPEHAKNALRMVLRLERERYLAMHEAVKRLQEEMTEDDDMPMPATGAPSYLH